ncbi:unnamed protein product [Adineta ricciae]|uniref:Uncharacterized protein n=1 Tax=Adineta ricciae TaxID=249248 RepID=A0A814WC86_ADIRI|nr:unnamed protein product [Adineta ricciae]
MSNTIHSPIDILCRELHRLDNDIDRLQMLITLKSHLHLLQLTPYTLQFFFSIFNSENYRLQALYQLIPFIHSFITTESLPILLELFPTDQYRLHLIETFITHDSLKTNKDLLNILDNKFREHFRGKKSTSLIDRIDTTSGSTISQVCYLHYHHSNSLPMSNKAESSTSGVFEKAKQFVYRVFGSGNSSPSLNEHQASKRLIDEDTNERKRFHSISTNLHFHPTKIPAFTSQSYTSFQTKSPPSSPIDQPITRQSSMTFRIDESSLPSQSMMVTQIHSILDNIDSVLDKIEAQTSSISQRSTYNENYSMIFSSNSSDQDVNLLDQSVQQTGTDQITQTTLNIVEHYVNMNDGSGDTPSAFIDLMDMIDSTDDQLNSSIDNE